MPSLLLQVLTAGALAVIVIVALYWIYPEPIARWSVDALRRRSRLELKWGAIAGFRIAYLEGGQGEPLVLLHGIGADKDHFTPVARLLTTRFRLLAPDLPGFGASDRPAQASYGIPDQVERLRQWLDAMSLERVHLGGSSMGGWIAAAFAAAHPSRVQTLWLIAPAGVISAEPSEMRERLDAGEPVPLFARNAAEFDTVMNFVFAKKPFLPRPLRRWLVSQAAESFALNTRIFRDITQTIALPLDTQAELIHAPTLVVWGDLDRVLHVSGAGILGRLISHAEVSVLAGVGHLPMLEMPDPMARQFLDFTMRQQAPGTA